MTAEAADRLNLHTISDLANHPELRFGFSTEFTRRPDGWPGLRAKYGLPQTSIRSLDHAIAYRAVADGQVDGTDVYTTEAEIEQFGVRVLADDRGFFPHYEAVILYRLA
jgi:osmoprotectant transport system permease protein